jgi:DNA-binding CsgD family transcriptional regulator
VVLKSPDRAAGVQDADGEGPALEERVRILCQTAFGAVLLVDDARRYVCVNDDAAELFGAPADVIVGRRMEQFTPPERVPGFEAFWASLKRGGTLGGRGPLLRYDGSQGMIEFRARWRFAPSLHLFALREIDAPELPLDTSDARSIPRLTPRQQEVLQLAAEGRSTREIAAVLVLSPSTVKTHFQAIYDKLRAQDRVSAVATALRLGLIS